MLRFLLIGIPDDIREKIVAGDLRGAEQEIRRKLERKDLKPDYIDRLLFELERIRRLRLEYNIVEEDAFRKFREEIPDLTRDEFRELMSRGKLDYRVVDGEIRFFKHFIFNFFKLNKDWGKRRARKEDEKREKARKLLFKHQDKIRELAEYRGGGYVFPIKFRLLHKVTINPGVVPVGEKVRVWIPFPRRCDLQPEIRFISASDKYYLSHEYSPQRTIYFEATVEENRSLEFWVEYEYTVYGYYRKIDPSKVEPYDKGNDIYVRYTTEQPPHIVFTPRLEKLAKEITLGENNPYLRAKKIFKWIISNITYNLPYEYSLYDCIPEFVYSERRGDCGMQALLFITLCRIAGIPARWQSGWYMNPIRHSMHDWAQFYIEPYGWLYADPSFGGSMPQERKEFYIGNIDHFRFVANGDISTQFDPPKRYFRSDPVDNQRGEIETDRDNLYYDKWRYEMKIIEYRELE